MRPPRPPRRPRAARSARVNPILPSEGVGDNNSNADDADAPLYFSESATSGLGKKKDQKKTGYDPGVTLGGDGDDDSVIFDEKTVAEEMKGRSGDVRFRLRSVDPTEYGPDFEVQPLSFDDQTRVYRHDDDQFKRVRDESFNFLPEALADAKQGTKALLSCSAIFVPMHLIAIASAVKYYESLLRPYGGYNDADIQKDMAAELLDFQKENIESVYTLPFGSFGVLSALYPKEHPLTKLSDSATFQANAVLASGEPRLYTFTSAPPDRLTGKNLAKLIQNHPTNKDVIEQLNNFFGFARNVVESYRANPDSPVIEIGEIRIKTEGPVSHVTRPIFVLGVGDVGDPAQRNLYAPGKRNSDNTPQLERVVQSIQQRTQRAYVRALSYDSNVRRQELTTNGLKLRPGFFVPADYFSWLKGSDIQLGPFHNSFSLMSELSKRLTRTRTQNLFLPDDRKSQVLKNFEDVANAAVFPNVTLREGSKPSRTRLGLSVEPDPFVFQYAEDDATGIQVRADPSTWQLSPVVVLGALTESEHYGILLKRYLREFTSLRERQRGQLISYISDGIKDISLLSAIRKFKANRNKQEVAGASDYFGEEEIRTSQTTKEEQSARLIARGFRERIKVGETEQYTDAEFSRLGREFTSYSLIRAIIQKLDLSDEKKEACLQYADRGETCLSENFYREALRDWAEGQTSEIGRKGRRGASRSSGAFNFQQVLRENQVEPPKVGKNLTKQADILQQSVHSIRVEIVCQPVTEANTYDATSASLPVRYDFPVAELAELLKDNVDTALTSAELSALRQHIILPNVVSKMAKRRLPLKTTIQQLVYAKLPLVENKNGETRPGLYLGSSINYPERCVFVSMVGAINIESASYLKREPAVRKGLLIKNAPSESYRMVVLDDATIHDDEGERFVVFRAKDVTTDQIDTVLRNIHCVAPIWDRPSGKLIFAPFAEQETENKFVFSRRNVWECTFGEVPFVLRAKQADSRYVDHMKAGADLALEYAKKYEQQDMPQPYAYWNDTITSLLTSQLSEHSRKMIDSRMLRLAIASAIAALHKRVEDAQNTLMAYYPVYESLQNSVLTTINSIKENMGSLPHKEEDQTPQTKKERTALLVQMTYLCALGVLNTNPGFLSAASPPVTGSEDARIWGRQRLFAAYLSKYSIRDWTMYVLPYSFDVHIEPPDARGESRAQMGAQLRKIERMLDAKGVEYLAASTRFAKQPLGLQEMKFAQSLIGKPLKFTAPSAYTPPRSEMGRNQAVAGDRSSAKIIDLPMNKPSFTLDWLGLAFVMVSKIEALRKSHHDLTAFTRSFSVGPVKVGGADITILDAAALQYGLKSPFEPGIDQTEFTNRLVALRTAIEATPVMPAESFSPKGPKDSMTAKLNPGPSYRPSLREYLQRQGRTPQTDNVDYDSIANDFEDREEYEGGSDEKRYNYQGLSRAFPRRVANNEELSADRVADGLTSARIVPRVHRLTPEVVPSKLSVAKLGPALREAEFQNQEGLSAEEANQILRTITSRKETRSKTTIPASSAFCAKNRRVKLRTYEVPNSVRAKVGPENCLLWLAPPDTDNRIMSLRRDVHIDCDFVPQIGQETDQGKLLGMAFVNFLMWVGERPTKRASTKLFVGRVGDDSIKLAWTAEYPLNIHGIMNCLTKNEVISGVYGQGAKSAEKNRKDDIKDYTRALDSVKSSIVLRTDLNDVNETQPQTQPDDQAQSGEKTVDWSQF